MVDQNDGVVSIPAFDPNEVDVTIAVDIAGDEIAAVITAGSEANFLTLEIPKPDPYRLVEAIRFKRHPVRFEICIEFIRPQAEL